MNLNHWIMSCADDENEHIACLVKLNRKMGNCGHSKSKEVEVFFEDIESRLIEIIEKYPIVVGCVAWLTNENILKALSRKSAVSIVVQKEDFLRPDSSPSYSKRKLHDLYKRLPQLDSFRQYTWNHWIENLNSGSDWTAFPVRCFGEMNKTSYSAFPRMHHKFLVFCDVKIPTPNPTNKMHVVPVSVWTGSFNMTYNATKSIENAVHIQDFFVASSYYQEWATIFGLSESLDWDIAWEPDSFRLG